MPRQSRVRVRGGGVTIAQEGGQGRHINVRYKGIVIVTALLLFFYKKNKWVLLLSSCCHYCWVFLQLREVFSYRLFLSFWFWLLDDYEML